LVIVCIDGMGALLGIGVHACCMLISKIRHTTNDDSDLMLLFPQ
jgi:hypothetical protein